MQSSVRLDMQYGQNIGNCSRFQHCQKLEKVTICYVSKPERIKIDWGRKLRQILHFLPVIKIKGKIGEIYLSRFQGQPRTQPVIGADARVERFNTCFVANFSWRGAVLYRLILRVGGAI